MKKKDIWRLFWFTLIASFSPCIFRYIAGPLTHTNDFDLKDIVYGALALLLSNVALLESQPEIVDKKTLVYSCWGMIGLSVVCIILLIMTDGNDHLEIPTRVYICSGVSFIASIHFSIRANLKIIKSLNINNHAGNNL